MSRRQFSRLTVSVAFDMPPGSTVADLLVYVQEAVATWHGSRPLDEPIHVDANSVQVKLLERQTTYL